MNIEYRRRNEKLYKYVILFFFGVFFSGYLLAQNKEIKKAHADVLLSVAYSPSGNEVLTSDAGNELKIWSSLQKRSLYKLKAEGVNNWQAIYNRTGTKIYSCSKSISIFDTKKRTLEKTIAKSNSYIYSIALSQDEKHIIAANWNKKVQIWNIAKDSLVQTLDLHTKPVLTLAFHPSEQQFLTASSDETIAIWSFKSDTAVLIKRWKAHENDISKVVFSPNGKSFLSASGDETIKLWNTETQELIRVYRGHSAGVSALSFSADGKSFVSGGLDAKVICWNTKTGYRNANFEGHKAFINSVAFSPKGNQVVSVDYNMVFRFWDLTKLETENGKTELKYTEQLHRNRINEIVVSKREDIFASVGKDSLLIIWGLKSSLPIHIIRAHEQNVTCVAISPNSEIIATGSRDKTIKLWNSKTGKLLNTLEKHTDWIESLAFSPNGTKLLSASWDKNIILWDVHLAKAEKVIEHETWVKQVGFVSEALVFYATDEDYLIHLLDIKTGIEQEQLSGHRNNIRSLSLSEDKKFLASAANDSSFIVWNIEKGEILQQVRGETKYIYDCDFLEDSEILMSVSSDGYLRFFNIKAGEVIRKVKLSDTALSSVSVSRKEKLIICGGWDKFLNVYKLE